jgi:hypothetical protein
MAANSDGLNWLAASGTVVINAVIKTVMRACTFVRNVLPYSLQIVRTAGI